MFEKTKRFWRTGSYKNPHIMAERTGRLIFWILRALLLFGLCYLFLFPILYMVSVAFQSPESIDDPSVIWLPKAFSLDTVRQTIDILHYWESLRITFLNAIPSTVFSLISCSMVGYSLARFQYKERRLVFCLVIFTIIVPPQAILLSSYLNFAFFDFGGLLKLLAPLTGVSYVNLLNTPWTFVLPAMFASGLRAGFFIFIFCQFFRGMPKELEEAARIDGCGALRTFIRIIVPLGKPAYITVLLFSFVWHWNDIYASTMYFTQLVKPITVMLKDLLTILQQNQLLPSAAESQFQIRSYLAAGSLLTALPPLVLYVFTQRFFTESIEKTGIVG